MRESYTYAERVVWPFWLHLVLGSALGLAVYGGASLLLRSWQGSIPLAGAVLLGLLWWKIRFLAIRAGPDGIAYGFGRTGQLVAAAQVRSLDPASYSFTRYMGWGYRMGWKPRERAYSVIGYPRGLRLVFVDDRGREWSIYLSSADPEAIVAAMGR